MKTLLVQDKLRSGAETLASLESKYAVTAKRHGKYPNLVQLKYDQIASPMGDPVVQECRGLILDEADNWRVVAYPFTKFFNLGEPNAHEVDWSTARVNEKLDGSLAIVYFYDGAWHMATSGTPDASGPVGDWGMTFKDLFWDTFKAMGYSTDLLVEWNTYMFELMTPENRVVVPHKDRRLVLIGCRDLISGEELDIHHKQYTIFSGFQVVKTFNHKTPEAVLASFETIDGLHQEGYVVVDANFRRVKVKHPKYVLYHQTLGSLSKKKLLDIVRRGETPEFLTYFPEWSEEAQRLEAGLKKLVQDSMEAYRPIQDIPVQKDFALAATKTPYSSAMFAVRSKKALNFAEYYQTLRLETLAGMLGVKDAAPTPNA